MLSMGDFNFFTTSQNIEVSIKFKHGAITVILGTITTINTVIATN